MYTAGFYINRKKSFSIFLLLLLQVMMISGCKENGVEPEPLLFSFNVSNVSKYGVADGSIDLTVQGGIPPYTYLWSTGDTTEDVCNLQAGVYWVLVTDSESTSRSDTLEITQPAEEIAEEPEPDPLAISLSRNDVSLYGANDGQARVSISGGVEPYSILWSNGQTSELISGLAPGVYSVVVTDNENQTASDSTVINEPEENQIVLGIEYKHPSQTGLADGEIHISPAGGFPPYTIAWSNGLDALDLIDLAAGQYIVSVSDAMGQIAADTITLVDVAVDVDGNVYEIITIGEQVWMRSNLRVTHAPDGTPIDAYVYNNNVDNAEQYGRLYQWDVAMNNSTSEGAQGVCPAGWHIPTDEEVKQLEMYLGMSQLLADLENTWRGNGVGTSLKAGGESGYDAQLSGRMPSPGYFNLMGSMEYVWTSTQSGSNKAWRRCLDSDKHDVGRWDSFPKSYGMSVRCIKNTGE